MFRYFREYFDFKTFGIAVALVGIGLISIYSATFDINNGGNFYRQALWGGIGLVVLLVFASIPLKSLQRLAIPAYILTLGILAVVLIVGSTIKGSRSWFAVGGLSMGRLGGQPSEFAKVFTVLAFASFMTRPEVSVNTIKHLVVGLLIFAFPMALILMEPDLGTTVVFFLALLPLLYWAGSSYFILVAIVTPLIVAAGALLGTSYFLVAALISAGLLYYFRENRFAAAVAFGITLAVGLSVQIVYERMAPHQQRRISTFLNPDADPLGAGYNVMQSKIAIGSGGFLGKGYLHGTQTQLNYIPEQWTDFIFCVPGEEFGFLGSSVVLGLFAWLLLHGITVAGLARSHFSSLAAIGITGLLATHVLINVGMCMGLMPVIGIPLPFLSYGGSALVADMMMAGLLMNFYATRKEY